MYFIKVDVFEESSMTANCELKKKHKLWVEWVKVNWIYGSIRVYEIVVLDKMKKSSKMIRKWFSFQKAKSLESTKDEGNKAFRSGNYQQALELYSKALQIDPFNKSTNSKLYCNRATVNFKLKNYDDSISDCNNAIELDPTYLKAYLRRAKRWVLWDYGSILQGKYSDDFPSHFAVLHCVSKIL